MGVLSELAVAINAQAGAFTQDDLERALDRLYEPIGLAAMVLHRYPDAPIINQFKITIEEAVEAHFLGLHHVAVAGLAPVIEGAGRQLAALRGQTGANSDSVQNVFVALAESCKDEAIQRGLGHAGEIESMMDSFSVFVRRCFFSRSTAYPFSDRTNRHGILHGNYTDLEYGRPLNFYKTIAAVDFLTFVASFRANISWFAPNTSRKSLNLAARYRMLSALSLRRR